MQSLFGFGYGVVLVPLAAFVLPAETAVAITIITSPSLALGLYAEHSPRTPVTQTWRLSLMAIAGFPLGLLLLTQADSDSLKLLIGAAVLISTIVTATRSDATRPRRPDHPALMITAGILSGAFRGAVSMPGPPVLLYQYWRGGAPNDIRGGMFTFNALLAVPVITITAITGIISTTVLEFAAVALPGMFVGLVIGRTLRPHLSPARFHSLSMAGLFAAAGIGIASAATALA
jgi:uncharacterized membrane protein YfcA